MTRLVLLITLFVAVALVTMMAPTATHAAGTGCLPAPLPTTTTPPVFSRNVQRVSDQSHFDVWRLPCPSGGSIVLIRITPITSGPFICGPDFAIVQGGSQFQVKLTDQAETFSFCNNLLVPRTFYLSPSGVAYDPQQAFTLLYDTISGTPEFAPLEIAAAGPQPPSPPSVLVVATACTTCHSGQVVAYELHITNPGAPMLAELKGGARFPDGSILPLVNQGATLPSGASVLTLVPAQALPGGLPTIDLVIEAAILEPVLGVTLSRHNGTLHLLP